MSNKKTILPVIGLVTALATSFSSHANTLDARKATPEEADACTGVRSTVLVNGGEGAKSFSLILCRLKESFDFSCPSANSLSQQLARSENFLRENGAEDAADEAKHARTVVIRAVQTYCANL